MPHAFTIGPSNRGKGSSWAISLLLLSLVAGCYSVAAESSLSSASANGSVRFKRLFMHEPDIENISGRVTFVSNPAQQLHQRSGTSMDHTYATARQADGSWMAYGMYVLGGDNHASKPSSSYINC